LWLEKQAGEYVDFLKIDRHGRLKAFEDGLKTGVKMAIFMPILPLESSKTLNDCSGVLSF
jgi:hypothetical protein